MAAEGCKAIIPLLLGLGVCENGLFFYGDFIFGY